MNEMATTLSLGANRSINIYRNPIKPISSRSLFRWSATNKLQLKTKKKNRWMGLIFHPRFSLARTTIVALAGSRADEPAPFEMSVENALKLLGVSEGASFDEILRAKNSILDSCKDDQEAMAQVEAAYDMLLMQSLTQRRAGKVVNSSIRYADAKPVKAVSGMSSMPQWLQAGVKNSPVSVETPSINNLGVQAGVYGALLALQYANGVSTSPAGTTGADVPGLILAGSFGASLYFLTKKNTKLGKATLITIGGLVVGAVAGSAIENWLQVDIIPFLGIRSPAAVVSEVIVFSQFLVSLYLS